MRDLRLRRQLRKQELEMRQIQQQQAQIWQQLLHLHGGGDDESDEDDDLDEEDDLSWVDSDKDIAASTSISKMWQQEDAKDAREPSRPPIDARHQTMLDMVRQQEDKYDEVIEPELLAIGKNDPTTQHTLCVRHGDTVVDGEYHQWELGLSGTHVYRKGDPPHHIVLYRNHADRWVLQQGFDKVLYTSTIQGTLLPPAGKWLHAATSTPAESSLRLLQVSSGVCSPMVQGGGGEHGDHEVLWRDCGGPGVHLRRMPDGSAVLDTPASPLGPLFQQLLRYVQAHSSQLAHLDGKLLPTHPYLNPVTRAALNRVLRDAASTKI